MEKEFALQSKYRKATLNESMRNKQSEDIRANIGDGDAPRVVGNNTIICSIVYFKCINYKLLHYVRKMFRFFQITIETSGSDADDQPSNNLPENLLQKNLLGVNIQINIQPASSIGDQSDRDLDSLQVLYIVYFPGSFLLRSLHKLIIAVY